MSIHNNTEDSNFRLKDCIISAEDIVNRAIELGYKGVSVTDHETVSSHIRIMQRFQALKKLHKKVYRMIKMYRKSYVYWRKWIMILNLV